MFTDSDHFTSNENLDKKELTKSEKYGLKYNGGFVCRKLTKKKLTNSKKWNDNKVQMAISFLKATRTDNMAAGMVICSAT